MKGEITLYGYWFINFSIHWRAGIPPLTPKRVRSQKPTFYALPHKKFRLGLIKLLDAFSLIKLFEMSNPESKSILELDS